MCMRTCGRVRVYVRTCRWWRMRARTTDEDPPPIPAPCRGCGRCICYGCTEGTRVVVPVAVRCPRGPLFASTAGAGHAGLLDRWAAGPGCWAAGTLRFLRSYIVPPPDRGRAGARAGAVRILFSSAAMQHTRIVPNTECGQNEH